jgi:ABC-type nitrate/sulfonate/bicarbonate transport system substrate-binding protein
MSAAAALDPISRRRFLALSGASGMAVVFAACQGAAAPPAGPPAASDATGSSPAPAAPRGLPTAGPPEVERLPVAAAAPPLSIQLVTLIPHAKGFFREEGFAESSYRVLSSATILPALISGEIYFYDVLGFDEALRIRSKGEDVVVIAGRVNMNTFAFFGAKGITSVADLRGKVVGSSVPGGKVDISTRAVLRHFGLEPGRDVLLVPAGSSEDNLAGLQAGRIQAALFISSQRPILEAQGYPLLVEMAQLYPDYQSNVIATLGRTLERAPRTVIAYLKAMIRTYQYLRDPANWPEAMAICEEHRVPFQKEHFNRFLEILRPALPPDGGVNPRGMEVVFREEVEQGTVDPNLDLRALVRLEYLEQAQRELGLRA